jgi:hypothetical protein
MIINISYTMGKYKFVIAANGLVCMQNLIEGDVHYNMNIAKFKSIMSMRIELFNKKIVSKYLYKVINRSILCLPQVKGLQLIYKYFGEENVKIIDEVGTLATKQGNYCERVKKLINTKFIMGKIINDYLFDDRNTLQHKVVDFLLNKELSRLLVNLPPGFGKTYVAELLFMRLGSQKTILVVPTTNIGQGHKDVFTSLGHKADLYHGKAKLDSFAECKILIIVINSLLLLGEQFARKNGFRVIIFDEVHKYVSEKRQLVYEYNAVPLMIGMSGTTNDRQDKMDIVNFHHLGKPFIMSDIYDDEISANVDLTLFKTRIICVKYRGPCVVAKNETTGFTSYMGTLKLIDDDNRRDMILCALINKFIDNGDNVIVLCMLKDTITRLHSIFVKKHGYNDMMTGKYGKNKNAGYAISESECKADVVANVVKNGNLYISTPATSGTGINFARYNVLIYAHSRKTGFEQSNCRIFRGNGEGCHTNKRIIVYFHDVNSPLKTHYPSFKKICKKVFGEDMPKIEDLDVN